MISVLEIFTVGIGPSSSHTVGPMRAAKTFVDRLASQLEKVSHVEVHLYGSLALTGKGHGTDKAVILGLEGQTPESVDLDEIPARLDRTKSGHELRVADRHAVDFDPDKHIVFRRMESLPRHPNAMRIDAYDSAGASLETATFYSIGGGFVVEENEPMGRGAETREWPYPWSNAAEILKQCNTHGISVSELALQNESVFRPEGETRAALLKIRDAMMACIDRGCRKEGVLPGGLAVKRRAAKMFRTLKSQSESQDPLATLDWISLWAIAVNEENAAGGRVVTAPTNGAAGIVPAVLRYLVECKRIADDETAIRFLLTAGVLGILFKSNASISGAEVGCQGEVGVACSMAAGALCEALGGTPAQTENAAEIGMEHNLGLTCDPIGGLVQIPCIERNATGAVKAVHAARLALRGDGSHTVSLDRVIATMMQTGVDMSSNYKETSRGGLAVNFIEC